LIQSLLPFFVLGLCLCVSEFCSML
jgi:hypothetical protein